MIRIYTDGACLGNPGPGGWAAVIEENGRKSTLAGREENTTNNRMEILAIIKGLEATPQRAEVTIFSDSQYVVNTMTKGWKRKANQDLWAALDAATKGRKVTWTWVRGHAGDPGNEEADALAYQQIGIHPGDTANPGQSASQEVNAMAALPSRIYVGAAWDPESKVGAWGAVVSTASQPEVTASDIVSDTNPSRLEVTSAIKGLVIAEASDRVEIRTGSEYLLKCGSGVWKRTANKGLWSELDQALQGIEVAWIEDNGVQVAVAHEMAAALLTAETGKEADADVGATQAASLTHLDDQGHARMVDVGWKESTARVAVAKGTVSMRPETLRLIRQGHMEKGDVLGVARIAGVMGAKRTWELIPLCHPIPLDQVTVDLEADEATSAVHITATAHTTAKTGVEMEAMTAVSIAALTIYDMCKSVDRGIRIEAVRLVSKRGGKSGDITLES